MAVLMVLASAAALARSQALVGNAGIKPK